MGFNAAILRRRRRLGGGSGLSISAPSAVLFADGDQPFSLDGVNQIVFVDNVGGDTTFTLTISYGGTINFDDTAYAALTENSGGDGTGSIDVSGSLANINAAFADPEPVLAGLSGESSNLTITLVGDTTGRTASKTISVTSQPNPSNILMETGDILLMETGDALLLEA